MSRDFIVKTKVMHYNEENKSLQSWFRLQSYYYYYYQYRHKL